jgi:pimeloyl-ACP methyl ester carboxylesterase
MGRVHELRDTMTELVSHPLVIIGHSWGAWLVVVFAATYPSLVRKIILVGSGPYEHHYCPILQQRRDARFTDEDKRQIAHLTAKLSEPGESTTADVLHQLGAVFSRVDNVDLLEENVGDVESIAPTILNIQPGYFHGLLEEAMAMRESGELLHYAEKITCPVVAIHGLTIRIPMRAFNNPYKSIVPILRFT